MEEGESTAVSTESSSADPSLTSFGPNEWIVEEMYEKYLNDPNSVDEAWHDFFADYKPMRGDTSAGQSGPPAKPAGLNGQSGKAAPAAPAASKPAAAKAAPAPTAPVTPVNVAPKEAAPKVDAISMPLCWTLFGTSATILLIQIWNYLS